MVYKRFTISVIGQLIFILAIMFCVALLLFKLEWKQYIYTFLVLFSLLVFQVSYLLKFITRTNRELSKFIDAINQEDYSLKYPSHGNKGSIAELHKSFNTIIEAFQQVKIERELQFNFLQLIIRHVEVGIMAINERNEIVLMNSACEKLLGVHKSRTWRQLKMKIELFCIEVEGIFSGGKKLIEWRSDNNIQDLSIEVINTRLQNKPHRLITINNIKQEIEQKELDAWIKLIRVLNHEIMNSTTPISSLTETIIMLLENEHHGPKPLTELNEEIISDVISSLKTIQKRSDGLFEFVNEYRKLTKVPPPKIEKVNVNELLNDVINLIKPVLKTKKVKLSLRVNPETFSILMDPNLIEQVIINLLKNAVEALENNEQPEIKIKAGISNETPYIAITDNGSGIEPQLLEEIFVPFFSTKEEGSGIGLSLSRQIMRLHGGNIVINSQIDIFTSVYLNFK